MDLIRRILLEVEEKVDCRHFVKIEVEGYPSEMVDYHLELMCEAELVEATVFTEGSGGREWKVSRLKWQGHEFLDLCRDEGTWREAKEEVATKAKGLAYAVLLALLVEWAKRRVFGT